MKKITRLSIVLSMPIFLISLRPANAESEVSTVVTNSSPDQLTSTDVKVTGSTPVSSGAFVDIIEQEGQKVVASNVEVSKADFHAAPSTAPTEGSVTVFLSPDQLQSVNNSQQLAVQLHDYDKSSTEPDVSVSWVVDQSQQQQ